MKRITIILIGLLFLISCDCYRQVRGRIIDKTNKLPLKDVVIRVKDSKNEATTDSSGSFHLHFIESGLQCYCKSKKEIIVEHTNFISQTLPISQTEIQLEPIDTARNEYFEKQFNPSKDFMNKWVYFTLDRTITLKVIQHIPATMDCEGGIKTFSITIGTIQTGDTIRVLELCNKKKVFNLNDTLSVAPSTKPERDYYVHPGVFVQSYGRQLRPQLFDTLVTKTTYGMLQRK